MGKFHCNVAFASISFATAGHFLVRASPQSVPALGPAALALLAAALLGVRFAPLG